MRKKKLAMVLPIYTSLITYLDGHIANLNTLYIIIDNSTILCKFNTPLSLLFVDCDALPPPIPSPPVNPNIAPIISPRNNTTRGVTTIMRDTADDPPRPPPPPLDIDDANVASANS